jgi:hypothetical protein
MEVGGWLLELVGLETRYPISHAEAGHVMIRLTALGAGTTTEEEKQAEQR